MLKHIVVWKIRDPSRKAADAATVKRALESPLVTGRRVVDWDA